MIDNFDSFVYNLKAYFQELGREILVKRCDEITLKELEAMNPEGIILSPGPKRPWDAKLCVDCAGAVVEKGVRPMHGKVTEIHNHGTGVFAGLPEKYKVTRYHSLIVREDSIPEEYQVDAVSDDGAVMGISHKTLPLYGVQFHPEAVLTEYGHELLENFCKIAEEFHQEREEELAEEKTA